MKLQMPVTTRECFKDCESKVCVLSDWSDWSECPQDLCVDGIEFYKKIIIKLTYLLFYQINILRFT